MLASFEKTDFGSNDLLAEMQKKSLLGELFGMCRRANVRPSGRLRACKLLQEHAHVAELFVATFD